LYRSFGGDAGFSMRQVRTDKIQSWAVLIEDYLELLDSPIWRPAFAAQKIYSWSWQHWLDFGLIQVLIPILVGAPADASSGAKG
jgi:hypothetical protein